VFGTISSKPIPKRAPPNDEAIMTHTQWQHLRQFAMNVLADFAHAVA
jgi:hypothetical protein